ncbi:MAG: hypothetical protein HYY06_04875 [Deltaproteobacteria bacterium]|nr:hypothetical protein [Deltaproteobacteria bacterium]
MHIASRSRWRRLAALAVVASLLLAPSAARASDGSVFDEASGWMWFVGTTEVLVAATVAVVATGDVCQGWGCGVLFLLAAGGAVVVGALTGLVAGATDARADVPFVAHHSLWGGATGALTVGGLSATLSESSSASTPLTVATGATTALAAGLYSGIRRDQLLRSTDATPWTHLMTWGPIATTLLIAFIAGEADTPAAISTFLVGLASAAVYAATITAVETSAP